MESGKNLVFKKFRVSFRLKKTDRNETRSIDVVSRDRNASIQMAAKDLNISLQDWEVSSVVPVK